MCKYMMYVKMLPYKYYLEMQYVRIIVGNIQMNLSTEKNINIMTSMFFVAELSTEVSMLIS